GPSRRFKPPDSRRANASELSTAKVSGQVPDTVKCGGATIRLAVIPGSAAMASPIRNAVTSPVTPRSAPAAYQFTGGGALVEKERSRGVAAYKCRIFSCARVER